MKFKWIVLSMVLLCSTVFSDDSRALVLKEMQNENRVALVIGNNAYQPPLTRLNNTINDAKAIRSILSNRGFEVIYRENVSHRTFDSALEEFYQKLARGGVGLLYFSGHGLEFDGQNYLIPTDAKIGAKSDTKYEAVALNKITHRIQQIGNRLNIVILDACRNDPFTKAYGVGGLAKAEPIGLFVSYATEVGQVSSDGRVGGNGLFTQYLIENMKKPLTLQEVFKKTRASVYDASGGTQFPAIYDQIVKGDFYFTLPQIKPTSNSVIPQYVQPQLVVVQPTVQISTYKWIDPTEKKVIWDKAKQLCRDSGGRLPTIKEFKKVVVDCGGEMKHNNKEERNKNKKNSYYQSCYKSKGFTSRVYWSSTNIPSINRNAWVVDMYSGASYYNYYKGFSNYVRCLKV